MTPQADAASQSTYWQADDPAVIRAQADAELKSAQAKAVILAARKELHWSAQCIYAAGDIAVTIVQYICATIWVCVAGYGLFLLVVKIGHILAFHWH